MSLLLAKKECFEVIWLMFSIFSMFSQLTPCSPIRDGRMDGTTSAPLVVALLSGKFLQEGEYWPNPEIVLTIQKLSGQSGNCPDNLKTVRTIEKLFGQP